MEAYCSISVGSPLVAKLSLLDLISFFKSALDYLVLDNPPLFLISGNKIEFVSFLLNLSF